jgi:cytochrome c553
MINNHFPTGFAVLVVLTALAAPAYAAEANVEKVAGEQPITNVKLQVCSACHGANGVPRNPTIPIIWGQQENYLIKQLHDFQTGARDFEVMSWQAKTFSQEELEPAATSFAKQNWPAHPAGAAAGSAPALVAVCQVCHQQNFVGGLSGPRLAGQGYEYLVEAMRRFADGERTNNADMANIMKAMAPAEREAMARYISGL